MNRTDLAAAVQSKLYILESCETESVLLFLNPSKQIALNV